VTRDASFGDASGCAELTGAGEVADADGTMTVRRVRAASPNLAMSALLLVTQVACDPVSRVLPSHDGGTVHPDPASFATGGSSPHVLRQDAFGESKPFPDLGFGERLVRVGELEGPSEYVFGKIQAIDVEREGTIAVLDSRYHDLRLFDLSGRLIARAGGAGAGPGEFAVPQALAIDSTGEIIVGDLRLRRLTAFHRRSGEISLVRTVDLVDIIPYDLCLLDGYVVLHGLHGGSVSGSVLHVFDRNLAAIRSFGALYDTDNPIIRRRISWGRIACLPPATIILVSGRGPMLQAYTLDGTLRWSVWIESYRPFPYIEYADRVVNEMPDDGGDHLVGITTAPDGWAIVQIGTTTAESLEAGIPFTRLVTYALHPESQSTVYLGDHLPQVVHVGSNHAVTLEELPFPMYEVHELIKPVR
jgi:hypothetical protein